MLGGEVVGVDINVDAMTLGRAWGASHRFAAASGEALPFRASSFDRVVARVSVPYMHFQRAISEMGRVMRPGAQLWLTLHSFQMAWQFLRKSRGKGLALRTFVIVNGALLHVTGKQIRLGRFNETFQTERSVRRALANGGFENVATSNGKHFLVTALRSRVAGSVLRVAYFLNYLEEALPAALP